MGRPDFEGVSAVAQQASIVFPDLSQADAVAAGGSDVVTVTAPAGYSYRVKAAYLYVGGVAGASVGTHFLVMAQRDSVTGNGVNILRLQSAFDHSLLFNYSEATADTLNPATELLRALQGIELFGTTELRITYGNSTDAIQNFGRLMFLLLVKERRAG